LKRADKSDDILSPHPPTRQKVLSHCVSDAFYRELFMNPCLSGWDQGEEKYQYMHLCHRVLSRSQFNAVLKLREAGIITSNLVALPNLSNISLANNGIHVSLGSNKLSRLLQDPSSGFSVRDEKYIGDLVVKLPSIFCRCSSAHTAPRLIVSILSIFIRKKPWGFFRMSWIIRIYECSGGAGGKKRT